jgi:hypothetical protein
MIKMTTKGSRSDSFNFDFVILRICWMLQRATHCRGTRSVMWLTSRKLQHLSSAAAAAVPSRSAARSLAGGEDDDFIET